MAWPRQWRKYKVREGLLADFIIEWRQGLVPIRQLYGFDVFQAWALEEESALLWLVAFEGDDFDAAFERFRDSPERAALDPDPARFIVGVEAWSASEVHIDGAVPE